jgi:hypothetical protein
MTDLLVDTDVLIDHLRGARAFEPGEARVAYSAITRAELFAGRASEEAAVARCSTPSANCRWTAPSPSSAAGCGASMACGSPTR